jgi:hypothetical protein
MVAVSCAIHLSCFLMLMVCADTLMVSYGRREVAPQPLLVGGTGIGTSVNGLPEELGAMYNHLQNNNVLYIQYNHKNPQPQVTKPCTTSFAYISICKRHVKCSWSYFFHTVSYGSTVHYPVRVPVLCDWTFHILAFSPRSQAHAELSYRLFLGRRKCHG